MGDKTHPTSSTSSNDFPLKFWFSAEVWKLESVFIVSCGIRQGNLRLFKRRKVKPPHKFQLAGRFLSPTDDSTGKDVLGATAVYVAVLTVLIRPRAGS